MGCSNGFIGFPLPDRAWNVSDAPVVTVYASRMPPPDTSWGTDVTSSPYPDSTRYIVAVFSGQAGRQSPRVGGIWRYCIPLQSAGCGPDRSPIKPVMRDEIDRTGS